MAVLCFHFLYSKPPTTAAGGVAVRQMLPHWGQNKMAAIFADDIFKCIF